MQRRRLLRISCAVILIALLWLVFAPGRGLFSLSRQRSELAELEAKKEILLQENAKMSRDIDRLQNDKVYLEQVAREEYGMLKKNEIVFDFGKEKKGKK